MKNNGLYFISAVVGLSISIFSASTLAAPKESICDVVKGGTPGLFGLCIAYNQGTKSPLDLSSEELIASLPKNAARILANYNKRKQDTDPEMPGTIFFDETACPVWTQDQLALIGSYGADTLNDNIETEYRITDEELGYYNAADGTQHEVHITAFVIEEVGTTPPAGFFVHFINGEAITFNIVSPLTSNEYDACKREILENDL